MEKYCHSVIVARNGPAAIARFCSAAQGIFVNTGTYLSPQRLLFSILYCLTNVLFEFKNDECLEVLLI